ncbi:MAG: glycosyltransferase [Magnetovibrio sp.]|nr:glycosyltransferase [Magnetovibrio sp.]
MSFLSGVIRTLKGRPQGISKDGRSPGFEDPIEVLPFREKWCPAVLYKIFLYFAFLFMALDQIPNSLWDPQTRTATIIIGGLGVWRYSWWFTHAIRAQIYRRLVYPRLQRAANTVWQKGWRPRHLHFMMTTFREHRAVTELVVESICRQLREIDVPGTLWLGSGDIYDEQIIEQYLRLHGDDLDLDFTIIRQNQPGKRLAIGLVLRAMNRGGIKDDDVIVFMDGDCILGPGCVRRCASLFITDPELQAVTTNEEVVCYGPRWVATWLTMRFAQRRVAMMSHALSKKVLTLTGRMSVFRARHLRNLDLIRLLEADHLDNWLWGTFRFLSGDDKSTWYYMLTQNAKMLYVPDAMAYTIEYIEGTGLERMVQNFRRWSGNMLRNGTRALLLGPRKVGFFIWWCVLDQRIAMWTMLVSPLLAVMTSILYTPAYLATYVFWILLSRMMLSLILFCYSPRVNMAYPVTLYFNQLINAGVKVYCLFRLSKQRWTNRGDQSSGMDEDSLKEMARNFMANYLTAFYVSVLLISITAYSGLLDLPSYAFTREFLLF